MAFTIIAPDCSCTVEVALIRHPLLPLLTAHPTRKLKRTDELFRLKDLEVVAIAGFFSVIHFGFTHMISMQLDIH